MAGVIVLLIVGIWWWVSQQQVKEVRQEIEKLNRQALNLDKAISELDKPEKIEELFRQRDTLSIQVEGLSEQATKVGLESQLEQLQDRLKQVQIQLADKEKEQRKTITNSVGMEFVLIPAGKFVMGSRISPEEVARKYGGEAKYWEDEQPPHPVEISKPLYLQTTEVSQAQWTRVMGNNPSSFKNCGDDCPVEKISWDDAQKFISKLNQIEGTNKYRLPAEAEWEYACRARTTTVFSFGNERSKLPQYAWYSSDQTHPVAQKKPNAWGLYDMHGNVSEWCQDWYGEYPSNSVVDPKGSDNGSYRVFRGGSWDYPAEYHRSAVRYWEIRIWDCPDNRCNYIGFRVARDF